MAGEAPSEPLTRPIDVAAEPPSRDGPAPDRLFRPAAPPASRPADEGFVSGTLGTLDAILRKLGLDRDELGDALSEVELSGADDNWRDESSGEVGLSFGLTEHFSIGPTFGLRYEEENLAGPREPWSSQLKLGARYSF